MGGKGGGDGGKKEGRGESSRHFCFGQGEYFILSW